MTFPFFLESNPGKRFCLYFAPKGFCRGSVLFFPPFAEEHNKSRRMTAMQARCLAEKGHAVLIADPYGCGDSSGDFGDARWEIWMKDFESGLKWLENRHPVPVSFWGLRFGALMALDFAKTHAPERIILWQPVQSGEAHLTQFLRLRVASEMLSGGKTTAQDLKKELASAGTIEIAGYELPLDITENMEKLKLSELGMPNVMHHWLEVSSDSSLSPASGRIVEAWKKRGIIPDLKLIEGEPFWSTQEITDCPSLIEETTGLFQ